MTITAEVIADSICETRITTLKLRYPRFIHAEFMTHRVFSRNAGSSRAIPVQRMIQDVIDDPAMPIHWGKNQPGMQAGRESVGVTTYVEPNWLVPDDIITHDCEVEWLKARDAALVVARRFQRAGYHKQIVNRLLEPFAHINVLVTATEWENFFALRLHPDAQPEIHALAQAMADAMAASTPRRLCRGSWHLPFTSGLGEPSKLKMLSAARCARISYDRAGEGEGDLAERLLESRHASPFEHQATPGLGQYANFVGWKSHRYELNI